MGLWNKIFGSKQVSACGGAAASAVQPSGEAQGRRLSPRAEQMVGELRSPDFMARLGAAESLGKLGDAGAVPALVQALGDSYEGVRWQAALALGKLGDVAAVEPLIRALSDRDSSSVRAGAAEALGRLADRRAVEPLKNAIDREDTYSAFVVEESREKVKMAARAALEILEQASSVHSGPPAATG